MNQTWMGSEWWEFTFAAFAVSFFTSWLRALGRYVYARDVRRKKTDLIRGFFYMPPSSKCGDRTPEQGRKEARLAAILSIGLATAVFLFMEGHLWVNVAGGHATMQRAIEVQAYMFLPFIGFNVAAAWLFERLLDRLPERKEEPAPAVRLSTREAIRVWFKKGYFEKPRPAPPSPDEPDRSPTPSDKSNK